jgi:hypothetical protein
MDERKLDEKRSWIRYFLNDARHGGTNRCICCREFKDLKHVLTIGVRVFSAG